jgi:SAM-dependent methyltransferase
VTSAQSGTVAQSPAERPRQGSAGHSRVPGLARLARGLGGRLHRALARPVCPVCGARTTFSGFTENPRESGRCAICQSFNRQRQMACAIRRLHRLPMRGSFRFSAGFRIHNAEANGALHRALAAHPGYAGSEYFGPDHAPAEQVGGIRHEDLRNLSYAAGALDLVLSSDVLEHMPNPYDAHREILRVLRPGGRHIFTVPYNAGAAHDDVRAQVLNDKITYLAERLYHGDPVNPDGDGILVWTIFGREMTGKLEELGFRTQVLRLHEPRYGIIGAGAIVFDAMKPG